MLVVASKTISITEEIYRRLSTLKDKNESFSQLFQRMIDLYQKNLEDCFGAWKMSDKDYESIWGPISHRSGRKWVHDDN